MPDTSDTFYVDLTVCMDISPNSGPQSSTKQTQNNNGDNTRRSTRSRSVNIAHLNDRSIKNREHYILARNLVKENNLDILTISESWLDSSVTDVEVELPGGGVCVHVNNNFKCLRLNEQSYISNSGFHRLWLKVQVKNFKSFICTAYRTDDVP